MPLWIPPVAGLGVSGGNTSGNTGTTIGTVALAGGNNITLSQSTGTGGATITISGAAGGAGLASAGISTQGNTAGTTGFASGSLQFAAFNLLTLSQATATGGQNSLSIIGPRVPSLQRYENRAMYEATNAALTSLGTINGSMLLFPLAAQNDLFPGNMTVSTVFFDMRGSGSSANSAAQTLRLTVGIYTLAGASSLSLLNSGSVSLTAAATSNQSTLWDGFRYLSMGSAAFSQSTLSFSQTSYWMGIIFSSSGGTQSLSLNGGYLGITSSSRQGTMGASGASAASRGDDLWAGAVATAALPTSIHLSNVVKTGSSGGFVPHVIFEAMHSAW